MFRLDLFAVFAVTAFMDCAQLYFLIICLDQRFGAAEPMNNYFRNRGGSDSKDNAYLPF